MDYFKWNDDLSVNDAQIDHDHQELIGMVNELHQAADSGKDYLNLSDILKRLAAYTEEHFQREEAVMLSINYSDYKDHKEQHRKLLARVTDLQLELDRNRKQIAFETAELLRFWLTSHILLSDKRVAETIRSGKNSPVLENP